MLKRLFFILSSVACFFNASAAIPGDWKLHPVFDRDVVTVIDTPEKVYMVSYMQGFNTTYSDMSTKYPGLYCYDKKSNELLSLNKRNELSANLVSTIAYNPDKRYLVVVYDDSNIELHYDDGHLKKIPALMQSQMPISKAVNDITFDNEDNKIYLATDFGYVAIDETKGQIATSRILNAVVKSVAKSGDTIFVLTADGTYYTDELQRTLSIVDFNVLNGVVDAKNVMPLANGRFAIIAKDGALKFVNKDAKGYTVDASTLASGCKYVSTNKNGFVVGTSAEVVLLDKNGTIKKMTNLPNISDAVFSTWDGKEIWSGRARNGLASMKPRTEEYNSYDVTRAYMMPNASNAFICQYLRYSPDYGMLVSNHGIDNIFMNYTSPNPILLSGLQEGEWTSYGTPYNDTAYQYSIYNPNGLAIDPVVPGAVYMGSYLHGLVKVDLNNNAQVSVYSHPKDKVNSYNNFFSAFPTDASWADFLCVCPPEFDTDGNLWWILDKASKTSANGDLYVWTPADRKSNNYAGMKKLTKNIGKADMSVRIMPLRHKANKNIVITYSGSSALNLGFFDHKGTLDDTADDVDVLFSALRDQDGNAITSGFIRWIEEDMNTGLVWFGTTTGVFYVDPVAAFKNPDRVNRVKVSRNDGTNLADYLLDNVSVHCITSDNLNRKWFATEGGGIVVTTADGREILDQITAENSYLPSDNVFGIGYNEENGSIVCSTDAGLAEFFIAGSNFTPSEKKELKIYPNPVRPDYMGWITIENLPENAVVKIVDAAGNLVKELGLASTGQIKWDGTNTEYKRVKSGVYFIMSTSASETDGSAILGKVLVVS